MPWEMKQKENCLTNALVKSHSRARTGCFQAVLNKNRTSTYGGPYGSRAVPYEFCIPVQGLYSFDPSALMQYKVVILFML